jgi:hypothetical protein
LGEKEKILREFLGEPITHKVTDQNVNRKTWKKQFWQNFQIDKKKAFPFYFQTPQ